MDNKIKGSIGDYRNYIIENNTQIPDMVKDNIISQLTLLLEIESDKIDDINEEFYLDGKRPEYAESPSNIVYSKAFDKILGVYVELPVDEKSSKVFTRIKEQKRYQHGKLIGTSNDNPILNTAVYNVETLGEHIAEYKENYIVESLYSQVDGDRYNYRIFYEIVGHRKTDDAILTESGYYETITGVERIIITIKVWQLKLKCYSDKTS